MNMKKAVLLIAALTAFPDASAYAQRSGVARGRGVTQYCARKSVDYFQLAAELNRLQAGCPMAQLECYHATWGNLETKELAGYALSNWLWSGPAPKTFTVAEQDALIADARARAQAARPASKIIRAIGFFTDFIVPSQGGAYFVGARANYGKCVPGGWRPSQ